MADAATSPLERLPLDLLEIICEFVALADWPSRASVFRLALASRTCRHAADRERFAQVRVAVERPKSLVSDVRFGVWQCRQMLQGNHQHHGRRRHGYVRSLRIDGFKQAAGSEGRPRFQRLREQAHKEQAKQAREETWMPLAGLVRELGGLRDLDFVCDTPFPQCLLAAMGEACPQARLRIHPLNLPTLNHGAQPASLRLMTADPEDLAIATFPGLYSVAYRAGSAVFHDNAALLMVKELSPRLRHVTLLRYWYHAPHETDDAPGEPPLYLAASSLEGEEEEVQAEGSRLGRLESLSFVGTNPVRTGDFIRWGLHTDLRQLRSLAIICPISGNALDILARIAGGGILPSLQSFTLAFGRLDDRIMDAAAADLLLALEPLVDLNLTTNVGERTLTAIIGRHAESLRMLQFVPDRLVGMDEGVYAAKVGDLARACAQLEKLEIFIPRTQGEHEVQLYKHLGLFPRLRHVMLQLGAASPDRLYAAHEEGAADLHWDSGTLGRIRDCFSRAAVDLDLALSICRTIQGGGGDDGGSSLKRTFEVLPRIEWDDSRLHHTEKLLGGWMRWLGRKWLVEGDADGLKAFPIPDEDRAKAMRWLEHEKMFSGAPGVAAKGFRAAWEGLWPKRSMEWWNDWTSLPLG